jgi:hypothetical protein
MVLALLICFSAVIQSAAQSNRPQWWYTFNHSNRMFQRWGYGVDLNHRSDGVVPFNSTLSAARMGINYHTKTGFTITGGYAWFGVFIDDLDRIWLHENRLYEQVQFSHGNAKWGFNHRIRVEHRFREQITNNDTFETDVFLTNRYRYKLQLSGLINRKPERKTRLRWQVANEVFFHNVEQIGTLLFDQNRTLAGVVILPNSTFSLALLYQLIIQQDPNSRDIQAINSFRITLFHQLDFRDKPAVPPHEVPMSD